MAPIIRNSNGLPSQTRLTLAVNLTHRKFVLLEVRINVVDFIHRIQSSIKKLMAGLGVQVKIKEYQFYNRQAEVD